MINEAILFAVEAHRNQFRKGTNIPYILHPLEAATIVTGIKFNVELITAAILHDIIEETGFTEADIKERFGERVSALVSAETEDKTKTWKERKTHTIEHLADEKDQDILIVTLGDKLSNIRAIHRDYRVLGDSLWNRFNKGKEEQEWYYKGLVESLKALNPLPAYLEFVNLVNIVFNK